MATSAAYVPLSFAPGEAYQFDWNHEIVVIAGVTTTVKVANMGLCHSRMFYVPAYAAAQPPDAFTISPVKKLASDDARNSAIDAISFG